MWKNLTEDPTADIKAHLLWNVENEKVKDRKYEEKMGNHCGVAVQPAAGSERLGWWWCQPGSGVCNGLLYDRAESQTLHPNIHGGLLARRDLDSHLQAAKDNNIELIDLVVVNLYPFKETILKPDVTYADAVENIDIGGPSMLRSAAKNHASVTVVVDPADYAVVLDELSANGETSYETRQRLAAKVYRHTASYDALIA